MVQSGGFLGRLLGPLLEIRLPLISNVIKPLTKSILISLGLTATASAAGAGIHKKIFGSGQRHSSSSVSHNMTTLIISNDEIHHITTIVKSLEDSGLLLKGVTKTVQKEVKEQKGGFLSMLLDTLGGILLGNLWTGKGIYRARKGNGAIVKSQGWGIRRASKSVLRAGYGSPLSSALHNNKMNF